MADTGSFPLALDRAATLGSVTGRPATGDGEVRKIGLGLVGVLLLASGAAATGINYEPEGYGALSVGAGGLIALASAIPISLLFRRTAPRR